MAEIDRSTVMGTFRNRAQAEQAVAELHKLGIPDGDIGLAGKQEVVETMNRGDETAAPPMQQAPQDDLVSVTVKAEERWREVLELLHARGAFDTFPSLSDEKAENLADAEGKEAHLEYDPIAGPQVTFEEKAAIATGGFGLERDPELDKEGTSVNPYVNTPPSDDDSFFGHSAGSSAP